MKIDIHAHHYPKEYLKELEGLGGDSAVDRSWRELVNNVIAHNPAMCDLERNLAEMDALGITTQVLSLSIPNVSFEDPSKSLYLAQMANDAFAAICRQHPERFMALASIPLGFPDLAIQEMHRAIGELGMCGLVVGGNVRGTPLNAPEFLPVFEEADRMNLAIFIHPMVPVSMQNLEDYGMAASIGYLFDSTTAITGLVYSGLFERCRNLKMIIPHMGGVVPFNLERIDFSYRLRSECGRNITKTPSAYFKELYYDSANFHAPAMRCGYETMGADHILFGSDYPFRPEGNTESLNTLSALDLPVAELEMIYSRNALSILRR